MKSFLMQFLNLNFLLILALNIVSNITGTIKTIFVSKKAGWLTLVITLIDAAVYSIVLKSFVSEGYGAIIAYILGHVIGTWLGDKIEDKIALGVYEIVLYVKEKETMEKLQNIFIEKGYSSTANTSMLNNEIERYYLNIEIARRDMKSFYKILDEFNIKRPTMTISELKTVSGRIKDRI